MVHPVERNPKRKRQREGINNEICESKTGFYPLSRTKGLTRPWLCKRKLLGRRTVIRTKESPPGKWGDWKMDNDGVIAPLHQGETCFFLSSFAIHDCARLPSTDFFLRSFGCFSFFFFLLFSSLFFRGIIRDKKGYSFYEVVVDAGLRKIINLRIDSFLKNWMVYLYDD